MKSTDLRYKPKCEGVDLSICIPTWNRDIFLNDLLNSIFCQTFTGTLEVVISDNASTDGTMSVVKSFQGGGIPIRYNVSEVNVGPDKNFLKAAALASGTYVWMIGSDDQIEDGGIASTLARLESKRDVYLQDRIKCSFNMEPIARESFWFDDVKVEWDFSRDGLSDYFTKCKSLGGLGSYLSSIIIRKDAWDRIQCPDKYLGSFYSHSYKVLSCLSDGGSLAIVKNSPVMYRGGNDHFLQEGLCKRTLIDFQGFGLIAEDFSRCEVYGVLGSEYSGKRRKSLAALFDGCTPVQSATDCIQRLNLKMDQKVFVMSCVLYRQIKIWVRKFAYLVGRS